MLILFTDYGWQDPYVGQVKAVLDEHAPGSTVIDLLHDVPAFNAHAGAHLIAGLQSVFPLGSVFLCVVDPGVGGPRDAVVMEADGKFYVGPDNGLLSIIAARAGSVRYWRIDWRPENLSNTFHGRDLFAPMAARVVAHGPNAPGLSQLDDLRVRFDAADLPRICYLDHYGNAWTGMRASTIDDSQRLSVRGQDLLYRQAFHEAAKGEAFWYVNSVGLIEVAANRASAAELLGLQVGDAIRLSGSLDNRLH
jgi:S-adenosyl-L-methionine hydrolase (adenosine-forming)